MKVKGGKEKERESRRVTRCTNRLLAKVETTTVIKSPSDIKICAHTGTQLAVQSQELIAVEEQRFTDLIAANCIHVLL